MTTKTVEFMGSTIEVAEVGGEWCVAIDGDEMARTFPTSSHALDAARRRVTLRSRSDRPTTTMAFAEVEPIRAMLRAALAEAVR